MELAAGLPSGWAAARGSHRRNNERSTNGFDVTITDIFKAIYETPLE
jgi:hypothetical protein